MQLQMLKKNMEPHFLFNNLSILSSLARKDLSQVDGFIEELADVYRYFLVHNAFDTVLLKDELVFLRKYIFSERVIGHDFFFMRDQGLLAHNL
jgi:sensor histidine kinase YesM